MGRIEGRGHGRSVKRRSLDIREDLLDNLYWDCRKLDQLLQRPGPPRFCMDWGLLRSCKNGGPRTSVVAGE